VELSNATICIAVYARINWATDLNGTLNHCDAKTIKTTMFNFKDKFAVSVFWRQRGRIRHGYQPYEKFVKPTPPAGILVSYKTGAPDIRALTPQSESRL
jgi:hypothetical protein